MRQENGQGLSPEAISDLQRTELTFLGEIIAPRCGKTEAPSALASLTGEHKAQWLALLSWGPQTVHVTLSRMWCAPCYFSPLPQMVRSQIGQEISGQWLWGLFLSRKENYILEQQVGFCYYFPYRSFCPALTSLPLESLNLAEVLILCSTRIHEYLLCSKKVPNPGTQWQIKQTHTFLPCSWSSQTCSMVLNFASSLKFSVRRTDHCSHIHGRGLETTRGRQWGQWSLLSVTSKGVSGRVPVAGS